MFLLKMGGSKNNEREHPRELQQKTAGTGNIIKTSKSISHVSRRFIISVNEKQFTHFIIYACLFGDYHESVVANKLSIETKEGVLCSPLLGTVKSPQSPIET